MKYIILLNHIMGGKVGGSGLLCTRYKDGCAEIISLAILTTHVKVVNHMNESCTSDVNLINLELSVCIFVINS